MPRQASDTASHRPVIVWFRNDLRLADNPALTAAAETGPPLLLVYVLDDETAGQRRIGAASRWWLAHSLRALSADLESRGSTLYLFSGALAEILPRLAAQSGATSAFWSRRYSAAETALDDDIQKRLTAAGVEVQTFNGGLGHEPGEVTPKTGGWYKVYSAFWRASLEAPAIDAPLPAPRKFLGASYTSKSPHSVTIEDLDLLPKKPDWSHGLAEAWEPGEASAHRRLRHFAANQVTAYEIARDVPAEDGSSRLSPHLRFGEVSPRQIVAAVKSHPKATKYLMEIGWRDFAYNVLSHVPDLATESFDRRFRDFPWTTPSPAMLEAWQKGMTGYPIVDAGMRQLWQTGWMHNRVRMIVASFLVKHLMVHWRTGEEWFWDTLCDADPANNAVNWQWVAGTGLDAAPYFRIFNPVLQSEKFDKDGAYIKRFVPELEHLPSRWIHKPWEAAGDVLEKAGVVLGKTYPQPIVDHATARQHALDAFASLRKS